MMKTTYWKTCFLLLPLLAFVACGGDDDGTGPADTEEELTQQEVNEMMEALAAAGAFSPPTPQGGSSAPESAPARVPTSFDVETTASCPGGGSVTFSGSVDGDVNQETGAGDFTVSVTQTHSDCVASSDQGTTFTFDGAPNLDTSMDFSTAADATFSATGSHAGSLAWATGDRSGTCDVDISYDFSGSQGSFSGSTSGTVCDVNVSTNLDVGETI